MLTEPELKVSYSSALQKLLDDEEKKTFPNKIFIDKMREQHSEDPIIRILMIAFEMSNVAEDVTCEITKLPSIDGYRIRLSDGEYYTDAAISSATFMGLNDTQLGEILGYEMMQVIDMWENMDLAELSLDE